VNLQFLLLDIFFFLFVHFYKHRILVFLAWGKKASGICLMFSPKVGERECVCFVSLSRTNIWSWAEECVRCWGFLIKWEYSGIIPWTSGSTPNPLRKKKKAYFARFLISCPPLTPFFFHFIFFHSYLLFFLLLFSVLFYYSSFPRGLSQLPTKYFFSF
jgi:hypothetical protein